MALSEPSVIVAVSAPHRGEAFAGARAVIDRVKAEAPIWKVEVTEAGRERVPGTLAAHVVPMQRLGTWPPISPWARRRRRSASAPTRCAAGTAPASSARPATTRNRRRVPPAEVARLSGAPQRHRAGDNLSARNRFPGVVSLGRGRRRDGARGDRGRPVPRHRGRDRDAVEELGLAPGVAATAAVKATSVMVERS